MKRWHDEQVLMQKRWKVIVERDKTSKQMWGDRFTGSMSELDGPGRMRKHRPQESCGCPTCQWNKFGKGKLKREQKFMQYEQLAGGW